MVEGTVTGTTPGQVSGEAKAALTTAIATAQGVVDRPEATQQEVNLAVEALNTAIATFTEAIVADPGVVKTALNVTITSAQYLVDTTGTGTDPGQVSGEAKAALTTAIATAQGVVERPEATQQEVDLAVEALNTAIATFTEAIVAEPGVVKTALNVAITSAQYLVDTTGTGTAPGQVSEDAKTALTEAIKTAQGVVDRSEATQQEVNLAVEALNTAIATFNEAIVAEPGVVKTALNVAITSAQYLVDTTGTGTAPGQVSEDAKTALAEAIKTAQGVVDRSEATQQEVNLAVEALNTAIATFNEAIVAEPGVVKTALNVAITSAQYLVDTTGTGTAPRSSIRGSKSSVNCGHRNCPRRS